MEYFNIVSKNYINALNRPLRHFKIKIEFLSYYETAIDSIVQDLSLDTQGQISVNYQQLVRRSCNFTLINVEKKYLPSPNSVVWFGKKFKLWTGLVDEGDVYWFSQGVYITTNATSDGNSVSIEGVDKGGLLNGETKLGMVETQYIIEQGSVISDIIEDTLMMSNINYLPLDTTEPLIDTFIGSQITQAEMSIDENQYIGDLFIDIANGYGADVFYDVDGRLNLQKLVDGIYIDGYKRMGHLWDFDNITSIFSNKNISYDFSGVNTVTVFTNANNLDNVSYTAYNKNPISPLRIDAVGIRRKESQEINYVDVEESEMIARCKDYADYLLFKESMLGMSITFNCPILPHLDVNRTIGITDNKLDLKGETFVIQSLTVPLYVGEMSVTATNIQWLPVDTNIEGLGV